MGFEHEKNAKFWKYRNHENFKRIVNIISVKF